MANLWHKFIIWYLKTKAGQTHWGRAVLDLCDGQEKLYKKNCRLTSENARLQVLLEIYPISVAQGISLERAMVNDNRHWKKLAQDRWHICANLLKEARRWREQARYREWALANICQLLTGATGEPLTCNAELFVVEYVREAEQLIIFLRQENQHLATENELIRRANQEMGARNGVLNRQLLQAVAKTPAYPIVRPVGRPEPRFAVDQILNTPLGEGRVIQVHDEFEREGGIDRGYSYSLEGTSEQKLALHYPEAQLIPLNLLKA